MKHVLMEVVVIITISVPMQMATKIAVNKEQPVQHLAVVQQHKYAEISVVEQIKLV